MHGELKCGYRNSITIPDCANINLPGSNNSNEQFCVSRRFYVICDSYGTCWISADENRRWRNAGHGQKILICKIMALRECFASRCTLHHRQNRCQSS